MSTMQADAPKVPYVGSRISLISKSGIRYVGTLYTIDTKASTVALKDVRSFGTEGRHRDAGPVQPSNQVYSYIIFRGPDIMDLQFLTDPTPTSAPSATTPTSVVTPPAPTSQSSPQPEPSRPSPPAQLPQTHPTPPPAPIPTSAPLPEPVPEPTPAPEPEPARGHVSTLAGNPPNSRASYVPPSQVDSLERSTPAPPTPRAWGPPPGRRQRRRGGNVPDEDFDFESMNRQFEKAVTLDGKPVEKRYDKNKSFFDSLVPEKEMRGERNAAQRRATDLETFGEAAVRRGRRGRGRGRGRGRRRVGVGLPSERVHNA